MKDWVITKNKAIMEGKRLNSFIKNLNFKELMPFFNSYVGELNNLDGSSVSVYDLYNLQFLNKDNLLKLAMSITQVNIPSDEYQREGYLQMYLSLYLLAMVDSDIDTCKEIVNHLNIDTLMYKFPDIAIKEYILEFLIEDLVYDCGFNTIFPIETIDEYINPIENQEVIQPEVLNEFVDYVNNLSANLAEGFYKLYIFFLNKVDLLHDILSDGIWRYLNAMYEDLAYNMRSDMLDYTMFERYLYAMYLMGINGKSYIIKDIYDIPEYSFTTLLEEKVKEVLIGVYNIDRRILNE